MPLLQAESPLKSITFLCVFSLEDLHEYLDTPLASLETMEFCFLNLQKRQVLLNAGRCYALT